jgi:small subunit ribosomal protein S6
MLSKYETVLIVKPDLPEDQFEVVKTRAIAAITTTGGHEIVFQDWGKKRLAYPIKKSPKGNYLYFRYLADGKGVAELERNIKVLDPMLRYLTVKLGDRIEEEGYDFEGEASTIFPFGVKPREPVVEAPKPDAEAEAAKEGDVKAEPEAAAEAKAEPQKEAAAEAVAEQPAEKAEAIPAEKAEAIPAEKAEAIPAVKAEAKPAAKADAKADAKPEAKAKAEAKAEKAPVEADETKQDAKPEPEAAKAEGEAEAATTEEKAE